MGIGKVLGSISAQQLYPLKHNEKKSTSVEHIKIITNLPVECNVKPAGGSNQLPVISNGINLSTSSEIKPNVMQQYQSRVNLIATLYREMAVKLNGSKASSMFPPCNVSGALAVEVISGLTSFIESNKNAREVEETQYKNEQSDTKETIKLVQAKKETIRKIVTARIRLDDGTYKSCSESFFNLSGMMAWLFPGKYQQTIKYKQTIKNIKVEYGTSQKDKILVNLERQLNELRIKSDDLAGKLSQANKDIRSYDQHLNILTDAKNFFST
ncbi:hypothetical protein N5923_20020 [Erwiniaceae bacterium BAC15a-03b]|uniref:Uncharacterized protein n=1 Tax=Winslowiella arboricola TaxID=2978220 RepID=A0A9J6PTJ2_9GAMM|nr:hypothetical protein [Winslowiella arboricola]MCU5772428.1 hypothetical protein [Winslowiella arboricola]MCU5779779.1 hypothetical protein [Winslowiella arboricola]